jgi:Flp pilus assembly protein TadB
MKNLFKLSNFCLGLFAFLLVFASCSKREISLANVQSLKLEKLSDEIEKGTAGLSSLNSKEEELEELKMANLISNPVLEKIDIIPYKSIKGKAHTDNAFKGGMKETKKMITRQEVRNEKDQDHSKVRRGGLTQRMKLGIILAIVGLLVAILLPWPVSVLGAIVFIIGAVLIIIELLNY